MESRLQLFGAGSRLGLFGGTDAELAVQFLLRELTRTADPLSLLASALFGGLFIGLAKPHFPGNTFLLQLLLQKA